VSENRSIADRIVSDFEMMGLLSDATPWNELLEAVCSSPSSQ
jgi:hypothetical protein